MDKLKTHFAMSRKKTIISNEYYSFPRIGVIPQGWKVEKFDSILIFLQEKTVTDNQYPILTSSKSGLFLQKDYFEDQVTTGHNTGYNILPRGCFTYRSRSDDGKFQFNKNTIVDKGIISCFYPVFRINEKTNEYFVFSWMNFLLSRQIYSEVAGTSQVVLSEKMLSNMHIALPPFKEQKRIAEILECCDKVIRLKRELLAEKKKQKKSLMQKLLNPDNGFRLPGFKGEWVKDKLISIAPLQRGFDLPQSQLKRGIYPVVYSNGILAFHDTYLVKGPGVVTGRSGTIGAVFWVEKDFWPHNTTLWVTDFAENFPKYIYYLYSFLDFSQYSSGSGVPTLNRNDLHNMEVSIPQDIREQQAIAKILSAADREIDLLYQELFQWEQKKKSLMQLLLTGKVRVFS